MGKGSMRVCLVGRSSLSRRVLYRRFHYSFQVAENLLEKEVLNYKDLVRLVGEMPHSKKFHQHHSELADLW